MILTKDPKPEIMRLEELAQMVKLGEIKLPRFQRPFVWKSVDMLKLLDSIYKGYPIGSILIWNSSQKLVSERSISGLDVNATDQNTYPTSYLLDGQQRLTTLCGALFWDGLDENSMWNIQFDLDSQEFKHPREKNLVNVFPLNKLINTSDFIRQCMKFDHHERRDHYFKIAERLLKSVKDYKIAVVKIGDMTIEEVAPIFERINSTGRQLTIVDLMMAATWSDGFDLTAEIKLIHDQCGEVGFDDIGDQVILRSISAAADLGVNKDDIQKLRTKSQSELKAAAASAGSGLTAALTFLRDRVGVRDYAYIPYALQLTYLAEFFRLAPDATETQLNGLAKWFWYTSATRYFGTGSSTGQVSKDLTLLRHFAQGKVSQLFQAAEIDVSKLLYERFSLRTAASTTFALLLNNMNPTYTIDGNSIDEGQKKLKSNKLFASFSPTEGGIDKWNIAKIIYPGGSVMGGIELIIPLVEIEKHLLNNECVRFKSSNDVREYLAQRSRIVADRVTALTGCEVRFVIPINFVSREEIDEEFGENE
jgi:hypothetical protein